MDLDEFLLDRIAEDQRLAVDAAAAAGREDWSVDTLPLEPAAAKHAARHDPSRVLAECRARRRTVIACRDTGLDMSFLGRRPPGRDDVVLAAPDDRHQLAALTLALLALPYAGHRYYRQEWRP